MLGKPRPIRTSPLFLLTVLLSATAQPAQAQLGSTKLRLHGGIVQPLAVGGQYYSFGPSVAVDAAYPLSDRLDLVVDLGWEYLNTDRYKPTPVTNVWRYRAELETSLMGDDGSFSVNAFALGVEGQPPEPTLIGQFWGPFRRIARPGIVPEFPAGSPTPHQDGLQDRSLPRVRDGVAPPCT